MSPATEYATRASFSGISEEEPLVYIQNNASTFGGTGLMVQSFGPDAAGAGFSGQRMGVGCYANGDANSVGADIVNNGLGSGLYVGASAKAVIQSFAAGNNVTANYHLQCFTNSSSGQVERLRIANNGNVTNSNGSYGTISDIKLKENIVNTSPKLDDLLKIRIVNYNLKETGEKHIGVIAQELEQIFPALIEESEDFETIQVETKDGRKTTEQIPLNTTTKTVKMSVLVPMLIKGLQETNEIIKSQQAQLNELKALINK
jgi:hypothetical protein